MPKQLTLTQLRVIENLGYSEENWNERHHGLLNTLEDIAYYDAETETEVLTLVKTAKQLMD